MLRSPHKDKENLPSGVKSRIINNFVIKIFCSKLNCQLKLYIYISLLSNWIVLEKKKALFARMNEIVFLISTS